MSTALNYRTVVDAIQRAEQHVPADDLQTRLELSLALVAAKDLAQIETCPCCGAESPARDLVDISTDGPAQCVCMACAARLVGWQERRLVVVRDEPLPFVEHAEVPF